jgi:hypothetical protein
VAIPTIADSSTVIPTSGSKPSFGGTTSTEETCRIARRALKRRQKERLGDVE